ncbi:hypothetical protein ACFL6C_07290 [Myxococcota bacterium]
MTDIGVLPVVKSFTARGAPPERLPWNGRLKDGRVRKREIFYYQLEVTYRDGTRVTSPVEGFGVERSLRLHKLRDIQAMARVDDQVLKIGKDGRFRARLSPKKKGVKLAVLLAAEDGSSASGSFLMPSIEILQPKEITTLLLGEHTELYSLPDIPVVHGKPDLDQLDDVDIIFQLAGKTEAGNTVTIDGDPIVVAADGKFVKFLHLSPGDNIYAIVAQEPGGYSTFLQENVVVRTRSESEGGYVVTPPIPRLRVELPRKDVPLREPVVTVSGSTHARNRVVVNGTEVPVDEGGAFSHSTEVDIDDPTVTVQAIDPEGNMAEAKEAYAVDTDYFLAAASGGLTGRATLTRSKWRAEFERDGNNRWRLDGRFNAFVDAQWKDFRLVAGYGACANGLVQTLTDEAGEERLEVQGGAEALLCAEDNQSQHRVLDLFHFLTVHADDSVTREMTPSRRRLFLEVRGHGLLVDVGNLELGSLGDTQFGVRRALVGARVGYDSAGLQADGARFAVGLAGGMGHSAPRHDELGATGGSVYYLSTPMLVEGSEKVSIVSRGRDSGLASDVAQMVRGVDYWIDYSVGRIIFSDPPAMRHPVGRIIEDSALGGDELFVVVDYEVPISSTEAEDRVAAGHFVLAPLSWLSLSGHAIHQDRPSQHEGLAPRHSAVGAILRVGDLDESFVALEVHKSWRRAQVPRFSADGGFTCTADRFSDQAFGGPRFDQPGATPELCRGQDVSTGTRPGAQGEVMRLVGATELGPLRLSGEAALFTKKPGANGGYSSTNVTAAGEQLRAGGRAELVLPADFDVAADVGEIRELHGDKPDTHRTTVQTTATKRISKLTLGLEARHRRQRTAVGDAMDVTAGAAAAYQVLPSFQLTTRHQITPVAERSDQLAVVGGAEDLGWRSAVGASVEIGDRSHLSGEAAYGASGLGFRLGYQDRVDESTTLFGSSTVSVDGGTPAASVGTGASTTGPGGSRLSVEDRTARIGEHHRWSRQVGGVVPLGEHLRLRAAFEGELDVADPRSNSRAQAGHVGVSYLAETLHIHLSGEARRVPSRGVLNQWLASNGIRWRASEELMVRLHVNYSEATEEEAGEIVARLAEGMLGLGWRPLFWLSLHPSLSGSHEQHPPTQGPAAMGVTKGSQAAAQLRAVFDGTGVHALPGWMQHLQVQSTAGFRRRWEETPLLATELVTDTLLGITRLAWHVNGTLDIAGEIRWTRETIEVSRQQDSIGPACEMNIALGDALRVGLGYNFSDVTDDLRFPNGRSAHGLFLRIEGMAP